MDQKSQEEKLDGYYKLNRLHLQLSFWSSLGALGIGLLALIAGTSLVFAGNAGVAAQLTTIGGVLTQFIGAGFFYLYTKNLRQLNVFYEKLIKHQDTMYAIGLIGALPEERRPQSYETVIAILLTRNEPKSGPLSPELAKVLMDARDASK